MLNHFVISSPQNSFPEPVNPFQSGLAKSWAALLQTVVHDGNIIKIYEYTINMTK